MRNRDANAAIVALATALSLALPSAVDAQVEWTQQELVDRDAVPVAFDTARGRLVLFTSGSGLSPSTQTWEWDGARWNRRFPTTNPPARSGHALAYDSARGRVVMFGGVSRNDTWEWDGNDWRQRASASSPSPRSGHAMAFDSARNRVVLFGGHVQVFKFVTYFQDTWEWDGASWAQITPATRPSARTGHALAYDAARRETLLFGGTGARGQPLDTWTFDGANWTSRSPGRLPPGRVSHGLAFDSTRNRVVLFGGQSGATLRDTWEWDGATWTQGNPIVSPPARHSGGLAFDPVRNVTLLHSGRNGAVVFGDLWQWDGSGWTRLLDAATPPPRHSHVMAYDRARDRVVVFGGYNTGIGADHWEWDGTRWTELTPGLVPPARGRAAMVYDSARNRSVMFGGELPGFSADTWEWDGSAWTRPATPAAPSARADHAMAFDARRARVVLFGGIDGRAMTDDTWEYDGTTWVELFPATRPGPRAAHAMAYDAARGVVVLFGGTAPGLGQLRNDTWEWDGVNWTRRNVATRPPPRADHALAYDAARQRVVLFGGGFALTNDTWEWDGASWIQRATADVPPVRSRHGAVYDSARERVLVFGGQSIGPNFSDLWSYGPTHPAGFDTFGSGCPGSAGVPSLDAVSGSRAWLGSTLELEVRPAPAASPGALIWLGASATAWGGFGLPLDLTPFGLTGCTIYASIDVAVAAPVVGGAAAASFTVPNVSALLGTDAHAQSAVLDAAANPFGAVLSNAGTARIGGR